MDLLNKLENLSIVSKVSIELRNHLGTEDNTDLAEYIIHLAEENPTFDGFKKALNEPEFHDSLITNLLRIIQLMKTANTGESESGSSAQKTDKLAIKFPGLAIPNKSQAEINKSAGINVADDMMAALEAHAPSSAPSTSKQEADGGDKRPREDKKEREKYYKRERDDDKSTKRRERSRERGRRSRSRHRSRDKDKDRDRSGDRSRDHRRRSASRDKTSYRHRSRDRDRKRSRSLSPRSRDRKRQRSRSGDRSRRRRSDSRDRDRDRRRRSRSRSKDRKRASKSPGRTANLPDDPEMGKIYSGRVANIVAFGCFVQLMGLKKRWEGLVHISQLRSEGKVNDVTEVVSRGANVKVKVMSIAGQKVSLSMKEVDQTTGTDLNPASHSHLKEEPGSMRGHNPDRSSVMGTSLLQLQGTGDKNENDDQTRKRVTRISSPERWEIKQMISSGVIDRSELPDFDEETGLLPKDEDNEADIEIEIVEEEPPFLQGHGRALHDMSPVRIVKNPDGSMAQSAMMQTALAKERREIKNIQREQEMDSVPTSLNKNWIDPLPDGKSNRPHFVICFEHIY